VVDNTKSILHGVMLDKEAMAGIHILRTIKRTLRKMFSSSRGRITNKRKAWVNVISACIYNDITDLSNMTQRAIGLQAGLSWHQTKRYSTRSLQKALLINLGDQKGYELI
jgi:hypothetical protein